ncbi:MAG: long-chain fatty acid--CoA ligase [Deltaproteobacteria bacterium HGW-Deltaproteobacteria-15]|nr:MAG: long-chain fatty acid--CoA ligase [Deltaproteobacteria bacterium HGW-Deltaproteobacteria-15]
MRGRDDENTFFGPVLGMRINLVEKGKMNRPWLKQYERHVPHTIPYPAIPVHRWLLDTAAAHPDDVAISFNEIHFTYREMNDRVNRLARAMQKMGVVKGDRIALFLVNTPTYVFGFFAAMKLGAIVVNISVGIHGEELTRCLNESGAKMIVTLDLFAQGIYQVIGRTGLKAVILHSVYGIEKRMTFEEGVPRPLIYQELVATEDATEPDEHVLPEDTAVLQYTSGSTGSPKAAVLTHSNLVSSVLQGETWMGIRDAGNAAVMCVIPFFHVFGMSACLLSSVLKGYHMVLLPRMDLMDILSLMKSLETYKPISFPAVPSLWAAMLSLPADEARRHLSSIRVPTSGGAPLPNWVQEKFHALSGKKIIEAYGLSEASSATHFCPFPSGGPLGSIGLPLPDTDAKIVDLENPNRECLPGEIGELVVKGPQIMKGYWNNPDLTSRVLRDSWFYTGDLGRMDQDGFFYLVDRKDDLIISSGFNIYPTEIEDVLKKHPKIKDAGVIGVPDRIKGMAIRAVVTLHEGTKGDKEEFMKFCRENMPEYRVPKSILIRGEIPRDPAGKMLRRILREEAQEG